MRKLVRVSRDVQPQTVAKGLKFQIKRGIVICIHVLKTKVLVSCVVTVPLICFFVFAYDKAHMSM